MSKSKHQQNMYIPQFAPNQLEYAPTMSNEAIQSHNYRQYTLNESQNVYVQQSQQQNVCVPHTPKPRVYPKFWETQSRMSNGVLKRGVGIIYDGFKFVEKQTMSKTTRTFCCQKSSKKCKVNDN